LINLRAFHDLRDNEPPLFIEAVRVGAPNCIERICARIHDAAIHEEPHVFCPPVCTFKEAGSAKTENLADGIALSVECDSAPYAARERLLEILGPTTAVVASGGTWVNPEGKLERKLHLHWRLAEPARDAADHERLREARDLAAEIVGADASAKSVVHPLRWPGSWHRKNPRLPRLAELKANPDVEIDLGIALQRLREACPPKTRNTDSGQGRDHGRNETGHDPRAPLPKLEAALSVVPNANVGWEEWNNIGMAMWVASDGRGFNAFDAWSQKSSKYDADNTRARWEHYASSPPSRVGAGSIFFLADRADSNWHNKYKRDNSADERKVAELAQLHGLAYQKCRLAEAKSLGIPVASLDKLVRQSQAKVEADKAELPHWKVEPWDEPVEAAQLLADIERVFVRYVFLPMGASVALALWTLHTWTMDAGDISPFCVLVSPTKRCGKTTVLIILAYLTPRAELASNISPSALFRYVEDIRPTLLIDEADSFVKDSEEMRGILNSGHTRAAAYVIRNVEINGEHKPRRFSTWAPKAIATIRELADTLEDRGVVLMLQRKPRTAKTERLRKRDSKEFAVLRQKAARWGEDNFGKLTDPDPKIPENLNDRAADNWRPLLAIADLAGGAWPKRAREAACTLSGDGHDATSINVDLLADTQKAFGGSGGMTSADLVAALVADPERPWATWGKGDKPLTQNQLARLLRPFGIISETVHLPGRPDAKGYKRVHFEEAWGAYCPSQAPSDPGQTPSPPPKPDFKASRRPNADETGTTRDFQSVRETHSDASKNANLSYSHAGLDGRTVENVESGGGRVSAAGEGQWGRVPSDIGAIFEERAAQGLEASDDLDIPLALARCRRCGKGATPGEPVVLCGQNGTAGHYHLRCWTEERTKGRSLTQGELRDLADQYHAGAVAAHNASPTGDVDSGELDACRQGKRQMGTVKIGGVWAPFRDQDH
jgi:hypothetical protein